jgi:putative addiction module component (TIGR02574 family)
MIDESLLAKVSSLGPADRLELIGSLWDTLSPDDLPVSDEALLDARFADMKSNLNDQSPWSEVKARLERLDREGIAEALRRDAEIEADPNQAITLPQLDSQIEKRRSSVRAADDRK